MTDMILLTLRVDGEEITYGLQTESPLLDDALELQVRGPLIRGWLQLVRQHHEVSVA